MILRWLITPKIKEKIIRSFPYRLYTRILLYKKEIRYSVEITTKCNASCLMCTRNNLIKKQKLNIGDMPMNTYKKVLADIKKFTDNGFKISFAPMGLGEPLMCNKLCEYIKMAKNIKNVYVILVSNGILLNKKISKNLILSGVDEISISLNCNNQKDYQKNIGVLIPYRNTVQNIKNLIKIRNKLKAKTKIFIQYLDFHSNEKIFSKDIELWKGLMRSDDKCYIHPIANQAGYAAYTSIKEYKNFPCYNPLTRVAIKINGEMYPCDPCLYGGKIKNNELCLGNINIESFFDVYNNKDSKIYKIVKWMKKGDYKNIKTCQRCNTYKINPNPFFKIHTKNNEWF